MPVGIEHMDQSWITKALGNKSLADILNPAEDNKLLDEEVVILLQGKNSFGDAIYSYVKVSLRNLKKLKERMTAGLHFTPSDFGSVVSAGRGEPSAEIRQEMAVTYQMVDMPAPAKKTLPSSTPKFWDDE